VSTANGAGVAAAGPDRAWGAAAARQFADEYLIPAADQFDRDERIPQDVLTAMSQAGLWAPFLPREAGGAAMPFTELGRVHAEIGRGCSSVRSLLTVHTMAAWTIARWGTAAQQERWLPALARGDQVAAVCITEPTAGSDTRNLSATAEREPAGWRISATKQWITAGQCADVFLVYAHTGRGLAAFLVPRASPGVTIEPLGGTLGIRASMLANVHLRDVLVDEAAMVGHDSFLSGMVLTGMLDIGRFSVAAGCVGIINACLDASAAYTAHRTVGGERLRDLQLIRAKISDMVTDSAAATGLLDRAAALKDAGDPQTIMATWIAKYFAAAAAARHASAAVQVHGARGCGPGFPVARYYRDAKVMEIIEGSTEIQQLTIAEAAYQGLAGLAGR
jgi:alkylation response protein AidB-like acyl-CoA dehydrogenase